MEITGMFHILRKYVFNDRRRWRDMQREILIYILYHLYINHACN